MIGDSGCLLPSPSHATEPHDGSMWARPTQCTWAGCFPGCPSSSERPMIPFCCLTLIIQFWSLLSLNSQMRLWVYPPLGHLAPDWVLMPHSSLGGSSALLPSELWVGSHGPSCPATPTALPWLFITLQLLQLLLRGICLPTHKQSESNVPLDAEWKHRDFVNAH